MSEKCHVAIKRSHFLYTLAYFCLGWEEGRVRRGMQVQRPLGQDGDWGPEDFNKVLERRSMTTSYSGSPRASADPENP